MAGIQHGGRDERTRDNAPSLSGVPLSPTSPFQSTLTLSRRDSSHPLFGKYSCDFLVVTMRYQEHAVHLSVLFWDLFWGGGLDQNAAAEVEKHF